MVQSKRLTKEEIKRDQFIETTFKTYEFIKENFKPLLIGLAVVIGVVGGFSIYRQQQQNNRAEAALAFAQAVEKYKEAESSWLDAEKAKTSGEQYQAAGARFQTIFQKYSGTPFADQARYNYAQTLYYQGNYSGAISQFQSVIEKHHPENQILALYAQKAIGNCYEQQGEYDKAIEAYRPEKYKLLPKVPTAIREHALAESRFSQARCYEKLGRSDDALAIYKDLIDLFQENLKGAIQHKSLELIPHAKSLISAIPQPPSTTEAQKLENDGNYYDAFTAYTETIHRYKLNKDLHGGLTKALRERIQTFETKANDFLKNLREARRYEAEGRISTALYYDDQAVGLDFAPSRSLYEKALLDRDRIQGVPK
jgi:predicted negative regulator of RcsB-dependent stress response